MSALESIAGWHDIWQVPNAAAAVFTADGVVESFGELNREFRLASVTKLLTTYSVLVGLEEGAVALADPAGPPESTLEHLLAHTSGYGFESEAPALSHPGGKRIYSNRGMEEVAAHLAAASEIEFADYLAEAVLDPLGLAHTQLRGSPAEAAWSTVNDGVGFGRELMAPKLLAAATLDDAIAVHFPGLSGVLPGHGRFDPLDWGLGFERNFGRAGHWAGTSVSTAAYGHFGGDGTFLWVDPRAGLGCVCLTDLRFEEWARQAWPALCDAVIAQYAR